MSFDSPLYTTEAKNKSSLLTGLLVAILLTAAGFGGYFWLRERHIARNQTQANSNAQAKQVPPARVTVYSDDVMLRGDNSLIGGTIENISPGQLNELKVELELRQRTTGVFITKIATVTPLALDAGGKAHYELTIPNRDYSGVKLLSVKSADSYLCQPALQACVKAGKDRPTEGAGGQRTVIVNQSDPKQKKADGGFINTESTADKY